MARFDDMSQPQVPQWTLGDRIRKARKHAGMSQAELAHAIGVRHSTIATWETDVNRPSHLVATVDKIAEATGVDMEWLLLGKIPPVMPDESATEGDRAERTAGPA